MDFHQIEDALSDTLDEIERGVKRINEGGCAVLALSLYRTLSKLGFDPVLVKCDHNWDDDDDALIPEWQAIDADDYNCPHVMVMVETDEGRWIMDSTGIYEACDAEEGFLSWMPVAVFDYDTLYSMERDKYAWNSSFDPRRRPAVRGAVSKFRKWAVRAVR